MSGDELSFAQSPSEIRSVDELLISRLERVKDDLGQRVPFSGILFALLENDERHLAGKLVSLPEHHKELNSTLQGYRFPLDNTDTLSDVFVRRQSFQAKCENLAELPAVTQQRIMLWGCSSIAFLPICNSGLNSYGVVMLMRDEGAFTDSEIKTLEIYLDQVGTDLYSIYRDSQQYLRKVERAASLRGQAFFLDFTSSLSGLDSRQGIMDTVSKNFSSRYGFDFAAIVSVKDDMLVTEHVFIDFSILSDDRKKVQEYLESSKMPLSAEQGSVAMCALQNSMFFISNGEVLRDYPMSENDRRTYDVLGTLRTVLHVPLRYRKQAVGVLTMACTYRVLELPPYERSIIEHIGEFIGDALANATRP